MNNLRLGDFILSNSQTNDTHSYQRRIKEMCKVWWQLNKQGDSRWRKVDVGSLLGCYAARVMAQNRCIDIIWGSNIATDISLLSLWSILGYRARFTCLCNRYVFNSLVRDVKWLEPQLRICIQEFKYLTVDLTGLCCRGTFD